MMFIGLQGMIDPPRPEVKQAVQECREAGIRTIMITGDHKVTAMAIAKQLDIFAGWGGRAVEGSELANMTVEDLENIVESTYVFARVSPEHKLKKIVKALQNRGHIVAMTGDGVNDAPAIKASDIGVAMGITGTDVAKGSLVAYFCLMTISRQLNPLFKRGGIFTKISGSLFGTCSHPMSEKFL
ncbi:hypothetical protein GCM10020331_046920 [Ectobacillus funiculus]